LFAFAIAVFRRIENIIDKAK